MKNHDKRTKAVPGERRTSWSNAKQCFILKEKQADGSWKHICCYGRIPQGRAALPVGHISQFADGRRRVKTADGWKHLPLPPEMKKKPGGIRKSKYKPGDVTTRKHKGQDRQFTLLDDGRWKIHPIQFTREIGRVNLETSKPTAMKRKAAQVASETPKNPRKAMDHTKNPETVKIPVQAGGHWCRVDHRTIVYRKSALR